jgi:UNC-50 family
MSATFETNLPETKGRYRRDDPSFVVLLSFFLCIAALAWGLAYARGVLNILKLMLFMVGVDFALVGLVISTAAWLLAKRFLRGRRTVGVRLDNLSGEELEFGYCFDVHCNAFFPVFVWLYVVQYLAMPLLIRDLWYALRMRRADGRISRVLGNTLYAVAFVYYIYITFLGYNCMSSSGGINASVAIPERNTVIVNPDTGHGDIISFQSIWIPYIEEGGRNVLREVISASQRCT